MALTVGMWKGWARPWGWFRLDDRQGMVVYLQYRKSGSAELERFDLHRVIIDSEREIVGTRTWRRLPLSTVEMWVTALPDLREVLSSQGDTEPPSLDNLAAFFEATKDPYDKMTYGAPISEVSGDGSDEYPTRPVPLLTAPEGRLTDDFLQDLAEVYKWFNEAKRPPAPAIASMTEVPVRRVHRWVADARKRGFLPPARPGRAG